MVPPAASHDDARKPLYENNPLDLTSLIGAVLGLFGAIALATETGATVFDVREAEAKGDGNTFDTAARRTVVRCGLRPAAI